MHPSSLPGPLLETSLLASAGSRSLKVYYPMRTTTRYSLILPLTLPPGMPMRSSGCTRHLPLNPFDPRQKSLDASFVAMPTSCAQSMRQNYCQVKPPPLTAARPRNPRKLLLPRPRRPRVLPLLPNNLGNRTPNQKLLKAPGLISKHTRFTRLETMRTTSSSLVQPTVFLHNRFAPKLRQYSLYSPHVTD